MAQKTQIQYIRLYTDGSAARQMELPEKKRRAKTRLPAIRRNKAQVIRLEPAAIAAILMAAVMVIAMVAGCASLRSDLRQADAMARYVSALRNENAELQYTYHTGYDLDVVESIALSLGMVPQEEVTRVQIRVEKMAEPQPEYTWWEQVITFLTGLFA